ncbi:MAG: hypothetical protein QXY70_01315 [Nanopusillaceae archaeon]
MKVFFDLDGVLFDFVGTLHKRLNLPFDIKNYPYPYGKYDIFPYISQIHKIPEKKIFEVMREEEFWVNLEINPKGKSLFNKVVNWVGKENVFLLTKPVVGMPKSFSGKYLLISKKLEGWTRRLIFTTTSKDIVIANPNYVLIDDSDENIKNIKEDQFILFPQPWNSRYNEVDLSDDDLFKELKRLKVSTIKSYLIGKYITKTS